MPFIFYDMPNKPRNNYLSNVSCSATLLDSEELSFNFSSSELDALDSFCKELFTVTKYKLEI